MPREFYLPQLQATFDTSGEAFLNLGPFPVPSLLRGLWVVATLETASAVTDVMTFNVALSKSRITSAFEQAAATAVSAPNLRIGIGLSGTSREVFIPLHTYITPGQFLAVSIGTGGGQFHGHVAAELYVETLLEILANAKA